MEDGGSWISWFDLFSLKRNRLRPAAPMASQSAEAENTGGGIFTNRGAGSETGDLEIKRTGTGMCLVL